MVLDFAAGAGTFPVAALEEGRNFIDVDLNDDVRAIKADSAMTDLCRATCRRGPPPRRQARRISRRLCQRPDARWQALHPEKRRHVRRVGWIAEFETAAASEAQA